MTKHVLVLFHKDYRLLDHPALSEASKQGIVVPLYIDEYSTASRSKTYERMAINTLQATIAQLGGTLLIRSGNPLTIIKNIIHDLHIAAIYTHERYDPSGRHLMKKMEEELSIPVFFLQGRLLTTPGTIMTNQETPYKVFTSFWKKVQQTSILPPQKKPTHMEWFHGDVDKPFKDSGLTYFQPGEQQALKKWRQFLYDNIVDYETYRDFPAIDATSMLSAYVANGEISVRLLWYEAIEVLRIDDIEANDKHTHKKKSIETFLKQLVWREFAYHQLYFFPEIIQQPLQAKFRQFEWLPTDSSLFTQWKEGQTGYPIVDAGMRELKQTGYMHNRVRMITASFLVKHLLIHWREGQDYFEKQLIDHDIANNTMGWQWVAGTGFDASPFFRIFHPVKQAEKFDSDGTYMKKWVPELRDLETTYIAKPWEAPSHILAHAHIQLGIDYPYPIVEHNTARERALLAFDKLKTKKKE